MPRRPVADRTSTATLCANQLRLWLALFGYVLLCAVRCIGLAHTQFAESDLRHDPTQVPRARGSRPRQRAARQIRARLSLTLGRRMAPGRMHSQGREAAERNVVLRELSPLQQ
jgi:hypothetical protein